LAWSGGWSAGRGRSPDRSGCDVGGVGRPVSAAGTLPLHGDRAVDAEVAKLAVPERARLMAADIAGLHTAGMGSMLVVPAMVAAAPVFGFVAGGAATVLAGAVAWGAITVSGRRLSMAEPDEGRVLVRT